MTVNRYSKNKNNANRIKDDIIQSFIVAGLASSHVFTAFESLRSHNVSLLSIAFQAEIKSHGCFFNRQSLGLAHKIKSTQADVQPNFNVVSSDLCRFPRLIISQWCVDRLPKRIRHFKVKKKLKRSVCKFIIYNKNYG